MKKLFSIIRFLGKFAWYAFLFAFFFFILNMILFMVTEAIDLNYFADNVYST